MNDLADLIEDLLERDRAAIASSMPSTFERRPRSVIVAQEPRQRWTFALVAAVAAILLAAGVGVRSLAVRASDGSTSVATRPAPADRSADPEPGDADPAAQVSPHDSVDRLLSGTDQPFAMPVSMPPDASYANLSYHQISGTVFSAQSGEWIVSVCSASACPVNVFGEIRAAEVHGARFRVVVTSTSKIGPAAGAEVPAGLLEFWSKVDLSSKRPGWFVDAFLEGEGNLPEVSTGN